MSFPSAVTATACALLALAGFALAAPETALAAYPKQDPNWPCQSIKVPEMSLAATWAGPPIGSYATSWSQDPQVAELAARLSQRRVPLAQAESEIKSFAEGAGDDRKAKLLELLAGLFDNLNAERSSVIAGLDRFGARQIELAGMIRSQLDTLHGLQAQPDPDPPKIEELGKQLEWETRTFTERRQTTQYACAVPDMIEHRFFALARAVQQNLS